MALSKEEILDLAKPKSEEVEVPLLGAKVAVRQWTFAEQMFFRELLRNEDYSERKRAVPWIVSRCLLDRPHGSRLFTSDDEVAALGELQGDVLAELFDKITRFSGGGPEAVARAGESSAETSTPEPS